MNGHLFLIQAHSQPELLECIVNTVGINNNFCLIHIDKKSKDLLASPIIKKMEERNNVRIISEYKVNWGGQNQFKATMALLRYAVKQPWFNGVKWLHLFSGVDYPIKPLHYIEDFFESTKYKAFFSFEEEKWFEYFRDARVMSWHFLDFFNLRNHGGWIQRWINIQLGLIKLGVKLRSPFKYDFYKGSNWFSISHEVAQYIVDFCDNNPIYEKRFRFTQCCDEVFFHVLVMNSPYKNDVCRNNLRYIDWKETYPGEHVPRTFKMEEIQKLLSSDYLFARKVSLEVALAIKDLINK